MKNNKQRPFILSQKTIRTLALLFVALVAAGVILVLGGFKVEWSEVWKGLLKM